MRGGRDQRLCTILLGEFFTVGAQHQRRVQVLRRRHFQCTLQQDLARRVIHQVRAPHHVGDALCRIVHHHGQLVGKAAIGASEHEVADLGADILLLCTEAPIMPIKDR